jgi:hypothetical protein
VECKYNFLPLISYEAFVWWQKSEQITASAELQKESGMPSDHWSNEKCSYNCVGSHVRPASMASSGKKRSAQSTYKMLDSFKHNTGDMHGHLKIYEDFQRVMNREPRFYRSEYIYLLYRWLKGRWDYRYGDFWPSNYLSYRDVRYICVLQNLL